MTHHPGPEENDPERTVQETELWWREWSGRCNYEGEWRDAVLRSLITLKALTYAPTGGIVAAATTSLPEVIGGVRNWDYRFCWLRDATFTLYALIIGGYTQEADAWRHWLDAAVAGNTGRHEHHVWSGRRTAIDRDRSGVASGLREFQARPHRQCRI